MTMAIDRHTNTMQRAGLPPSMVERMTLIVDAFDSRFTRLNLEQIARQTQLPRSTAHRILDQLVRLDWLEHSPLGYCLGRRALRLGGQDGAHAEIRSAAADVMHRLHLRTGMVVHLSVLEGSVEVCLDKVSNRFTSALPVTAGLRQSAHQSTGGRAMLAWLSPEQVDQLVGVRLSRPPRPGEWDIVGLHRELNRIRTRGGISLDRGEFSTAVPSVATAIRTDEGPVAAIGLWSEAGSAQLERVVPLVSEAGRTIAQALLPERRPTSTRR